MLTNLLEIIESEGDVSVLRVNRSLLSTPAVRAVCDRLDLLADTGSRKLHLDFGRVEYVTPAGLGLLLDLHARLRAAGGGLRLCDAGACFDLMRLSGLPDACPAGMSQPA
jgi:anti-anti-sigma regulatory factor